MKIKAKTTPKKSIIRIVVLVLVVLIAFPFLYPVVTPYKSVEQMKDYHGITTGTIVSVTVSNMGITGTKTTDSEILEQWNSFIKEAKYKPKCIFIYGTKPNWVKIVMSTGEIYFFERWPYFENGHSLAVSREVRNFRTPKNESGCF